MKNIDSLIENIKVFTSELESLKQEYKTNEKSVFHSIVDNSQNSIIIIQKQQIMYINPSGYCMLGYGYASNITGSNIMDFIYPDDKMLLQQHMQEHKKKFNFELRLIKSNEKTIYTEAVLVPFIYNRKDAILLICNDITCHKKTLNKICKSEERLRMIFDNAPMGIFQSTPGGKFIDVNPSLARMLGFSSAQETIKKINDIGKDVYLVPDERKKIIKSSLIKEQVRRNEIILKKRDNTYFIANLYFRAVKDRHGYPKYFEGIVEDITERKEAEQALKASENKYKSLYKNAPLPYQSLNYEGLIIDVNPAWLQTLGYKRDEVIGYPFTDLLAKNDISTFNSKFNEFKESGKTINTILSMKKANNEYLVASFTGLFDYDIKGNAKLSYWVFKDITNEKKREKQNKQMAADAMYINQKNKILKEVQVTLEKICQQNKAVTRKTMQPVFNLIYSNLQADKDWDLLKHHFEELHKNFFNDLMKKHPSLTQNDLRHCGYIKMNLSTKEIARMNNVKPATVQNSRVRLKKKLKLPKEVDLRQYILGF